MKKRNSLLLGTRIAITSFIANKKLFSSMSIASVSSLTSSYRIM